MTEECCGNCRFWNHGMKPDGLDCKECRRFPPTIPIVDHVTDRGVEVHLRTDGGDVVYTTRPRTDAGEWCGEWKPDYEILPDYA